jgi:hypothetical protein
MQKQVNAEKHALDRILYLLEEHSIQHLSADDAGFAHLINSIYDQVDEHARLLTA